MNLIIAHCTLHIVALSNYLLVEEYWNSLGIRFRKKCGMSSENLWNSWWVNINCRKFSNSKHK